MKASIQLQRPTVNPNAPPSLRIHEKGVTVAALGGVVRSICQIGGASEPRTLYPVSGRVCQGYLWSRSPDWDSRNWGTSHTFRHLLALLGP